MIAFLPLQSNYLQSILNRHLITRHINDIAIDLASPARDKPICRPACTYVDFHTCHALRRVYFLAEKRRKSRMT